MTRQEMKMESLLYFRIQRLERIAQKMQERIDTLHIVHDKPHTIKHVHGKISEQLTEMRSLHSESMELIHGTTSVKKRGEKTVRDLYRDFKKIGRLKERMERCLN